MDSSSSFSVSAGARATQRVLGVVPLRARTSATWRRTALEDLPTLLEDHCQCELKAAANALSLIGRNPAKNVLVDRMQRLAKEELQHYQLLRECLGARAIVPRNPQRSPYMSGLHAAHRQGIPALLGSLLVSALVEARSCERFAALEEDLREALGITERENLAQMYGNLARSEGGHAATFIELAKLYFEAELVDEELERRLRHEATLLAEIPLSARMHGGNGESA
jgi:tRNA-(ms[2]io[6]A)-hydroxylase